MDTLQTGHLPAFSVAKNGLIALLTVVLDIVTMKSRFTLPRSILMVVRGGNHRAIEIP